MLSADLSMIGANGISTPAFENLTHLEILGLKGSGVEDCEALKTLPKLTHLCFDVSAYVEKEVIDDMLKHCPSLLVLVYAFSPVDGSFESSGDNPNFSIVSDDPRFVVFEEDVCMEVAIAEWKRSSTHGQSGFWEVAEKIIEARRSKFFFFCFCISIRLEFISPVCREFL